MSAFKSAARFLARTAFAVLAVAVVLWLVPLVWETVIGADPRHADRVLADLESVERWSKSQLRASAHRYERLRGAVQKHPTSVALRRVQDEIAKVEDLLAKDVEGPRLKRGDFHTLVELALRDRLVPAVEAEVRISVREGELQALRRLRDHLLAASSYEEREREVEVRRQAHQDAHEARTANEKAQKVVCDQHYLACRVPFTDAYRRLSELRKQWTELNAASWKAYKVWEEAKTSLEQTPKPGSVPEDRRDASGIDALFSSIRSEIYKVQEGIGKHLWLLAAALGPAALIVLGSLLFGVAIKAVLFFILAPLASRRPAIQLGAPPQDPAGSSVAPAASSTVSLEVALEPDHELLVKGDYLQSAARTARTTTKFLLNAKYPFSSLASGMWLLTRVQPAERHSVVVSSTHDPLSEISTLALAQNETIALQPQHLVGVVHPKGTPVRISSVWRLGLHSWLTLQFRYLTFHGPATLLVKGCRGVRVETARHGLSISQAATIGFSATLGYSTVPTETFIAYLLAQKPLFNDRFAGEHGYVAYQEIPRSETRAGFTGRSLQGLMDGFMKAFGI